MKLYYMPGAASLAAHVVLEWAGADYEAVRMDRRTLKAPGFLSLNPAGTVPLLQDGNFFLTESVAILQYVADGQPDHRLMGDGSARSRAEVMRWLAFLNSDVNLAFGPIFSPGRYLQDETALQPLAEKARHRVRTYLSILERQLGGRQWLTGMRSVADAYLLVIMRWALSTKVGVRDFQNLAAYTRRIHEDPGAHAALVVEESLQARMAAATPVDDSLRRLNARMADDPSATFSAEIVGPVGYREGEGVELELRRGRVRILVTPSDTVVSWTDEKYRGEAAIPYANFAQYVADGAIRLIF